MASTKDLGLVRGNNGATGPQGATGARGNCIWMDIDLTISGMSPSPSVIGRNPQNGDLFINTSNWNVYQVTGVSNGNITVSGPYLNLRGATGAAGAIGPQGPQGAKGATGATGPQGTRGNIVWVAPQGGTAVSGFTPTPAQAGRNPQSGDFLLSGSSYNLFVITGLSGSDVTYNATPLCNLRGATGAAGAQGPKGDTGARGATGPQGHSWNLHIGKYESMGTSQDYIQIWYQSSSNYEAGDIALYRKNNHLYVGTLSGNTAGPAGITLYAINSPRQLL